MHPADVMPRHSGAALDRRARQSTSSRACFVRMATCAPRLDRAYVSLTKVSLDCPACSAPETLVIPPQHPEKPFRYEGAFVHMLLENDGQTPAYEIDENVTLKHIPISDLIRDTELPLPLCLSRISTKPHRRTQ